MVSVFNFGLLGFFLFSIIAVQSAPLLESSNTSEDNKPSKTNQQLYEIYKTMRADPRLASISNKNLVLYIHRNFVNGNNDDIVSIKENDPNQQQKSN
jgi:hypothetical protein